MVKDVLESRGHRPNFFSCRYFRYDLKYIAKPDLMPLLVQDTSVVEDLIQSIYQLHFSDVQENLTHMAEFGDSTTEFLLILAQVDLDLVSVLESKYLSYVERVQDVARLMKYFRFSF